MIVIEGPDASGKTTLAKRLEILGFNYHHFDKESSYEDYLAPLCNLDLLNAVLDRCMVSEYPYSMVMNRKFRFSLKEWHNLLLLTLIQNPLIILCVNKPLQFKYSAGQYLPYEKWDRCLKLYKEFLTSHHIPFMEYDYQKPRSIEGLVSAAVDRRRSIDWWVPMHRAGYGAIGSPNPKVLLVAERLGPNNLQNLPFSHGPTGHMLTDMLTATGTPLGKIAVTNLVKSFRRDPRPPNQEDLDLLKIELENLRPDKVVFMGAPAKQGIKVAKELDIPHVEIPHLGYYHHKGITDMSSYYAGWKKIMGMVKDFKLGGEK